MLLRALGFLSIVGASSEGGLLPAQEKPPAPLAKEDKSGTNPANFQKTLQLKAEGYSLADGNSFGNVNELIYSHPLGKWKLDFEVPFLIGTDIFGPTQYGFGDVSVSAKTKPYLSHKLAVIAGVELFVPTGSRDELSSNRWSLGPSATVAFFYPKRRLIFGPTYQHKFSFTGSSEPANFSNTGSESTAPGAPVEPGGSVGKIHQGVFDLYLVYQFKGGKSWITIDPAISIDYANDWDTSVSVAPAYGFFIGPGRSAMIQPLIPLTSGSLDWGIKASLKQVF
jgi:hypothetical protein